MRSVIGLWGTNSLRFLLCCRSSLRFTVRLARSVARSIATYKFSKRVTLKSKPDGRKFRRFKGVGTRASNVIAYVDATASFGLKLRIEKVRGNRIGTAISSLRHLRVFSSHCVLQTLQDCQIKSLVNSLTRKSKFFVDYSIHIEETNQHRLDL